MWTIFPDFYELTFNRIILFYCANQWNYLKNRKETNQHKSTSWQKKEWYFFRVGELFFFFFKLTVSEIIKPTSNRVFSSIRHRISLRKFLSSFIKYVNNKKTTEKKSADKKRIPYARDKIYFSFELFFYYYVRKRILVTNPVSEFNSRVRKNFQLTKMIKKFRSRQECLLQN